MQLLGELQQELGQVRQASVRQELLLVRLSSHLHLEAIQDRGPWVSAEPSVEVKRSGSHVRAPLDAQHANVFPASPLLMHDDDDRPLRIRASIESFAPVSEEEAGAKIDYQSDEMSVKGDRSSMRTDRTESSQSAWARCKERALPPSEFTKTLAELASLPPAAGAPHTSVIHTLLTTTATSSASESEDLLAGLRGSAWPPDSPTRLIYEGLSMLVLLYDAFSVPYLICWNVPEVEFWLVGIGWLVRFYWTVDIFLNFFTGYWEQNLRLELRVRRTARHYLTTFFPLDLSLFVWDWISLISPGLRIMRSMRLVRLGRQTRRAAMVVFKLKAMNPKREFHLFLDMGIIMVSIFWLTHVWCCIWYVIGLDFDGSDTGTTWLSHLRDGSGRDAGGSYEYTTALHWSLTQITPGSMEVVPKTTKERVYNVVILFIGLILGTSLIATITAMITQYRMHLESTSKDFRMLQSYLTQSGASPGLSMAIKKQVLDKLRLKAKVKAGEVRYLAWSANSLQEALWCQVCMAHLQLHPFWSAWGRVNVACLASFCNSALESRSYVPSDLVFEEGRCGNEMYIVAAGELDYSPGSASVENIMNPASFSCRLLKGMWCVEAALWMKWDHTGSMHCSQSSELLCVNISRWQGDVGRFPEEAGLLLEYAKVFVEHFRGLARSDLVHSLNYYELISDAPQESRLKISSPIIDLLDSMTGSRSTNVLRSNGNSRSILDPFGGTRIKRLHPLKISKLRHEVITGKSDIGVLDGELARFIFVVALRILHPQSGSSRLPGPSRDKDEERFLVKVAERNRSGCTKVSVELPGTKRRGDESCEVALKRLINTELQRISPALKLNTDSREVDVFFKESPTYGISSRYSRTIFLGCVRRNLAPFTVPAPSAELELELTRKPSRLSAFWRRRDVHAEEALQLEVMRILRTISEVIVLPANDEEVGTYDVYIWLQQSEFEALANEKSKPTLQKWAQGINATDDDTENCAFNTYL